MFESLETGLGLEVVLTLQTLRNDLFDLLVAILDVLGGEIGYLAVGLLFFLAINKALGWRLYFALVSMTAVVEAFKLGFGRPRPFMVSDEVVAVIEAESFGFISGHTGITLVFFGVIALWYRRPWVTLLVALYVLLQAFGRMYAGVHYPQDVIGSMIVGPIVLLLYWRAIEPVSRLWAQWTPPVQAAVVLVLGWVGTLLVPSDNGITTMALLIGGGWAVIIEPRIAHFGVGGAWPLRLVRVALGLVIGLGLLFGLDALIGELEPQTPWRLLRYGLLAFTVLALYPAVAVRTGLAPIDDIPPPEDAATSLEAAT